MRVLIFVCGAVLMSLEILGSRVLAPHYGNSIIVWGSLIGVFLAALSAGYSFGGWAADRMPRLTAMSGLVAAAGLYICAIPQFAEAVFAICGDSLRAGSLYAAAILFFIPVMLLGFVAPYAIRLQGAQTNRLGRSAGGLYALSTLGSIAGTIATAFWLVPLAGVPTLIRGLGLTLIVAAASIMAGIAHSLKVRRIAAAAGVGFVVVVSVTLVALERQERHPSASSRRERVLFEKDTFYHHIRVTDDGEIRQLHFDNSNQSAIFLAHPLVSAYPFVEYFHLARVFVPEPREVLLIGLGGGVVARQYAAEVPGVHVDAAEIDPEVVSVSHRFFFFPESDPRIHVAAEDGRRFLTKSDRQYDIILVDAFYRDSIPFHLVTREFMDLCRQKLRPHGVVMFNFIGTIRGPRSGLFDSLYRTAGTVFDERYVFAPYLRFPSLDNRLRNCFLIAGTQTKMSDEQLGEAVALARRRGVSETYLQHANEYLTREPDASRGRVFTDAYAPVDDLLNMLQQ